MQNDRAGLQEPLLPRQDAGAPSRQRTTDGGAIGSDEEVGINNQNSPEFHRQEHDSEENGILLHKKFRLKTLAVAIANLIITVLVSLAIDGKEVFFHRSAFNFGSSVIDIVLIALARTALLMFQTSNCTSLLATKIAGYTSLFSLLFIIVKMSCATDFLLWHAKPHLYAVLLLLEFSFCATECIFEFLIGIYSSDDLSRTVAPTASEAAEGIAIDEVKSIGTLELLKVLKPYFWPEGLLNRCCVFMTWVFLILSKASNILAPLYIASATDDLATKQTSVATKHIFIYAGLLLSNKIFKEFQALAYIRVKLIAGLQLQEKIFTHLLSLSIDWHQRKSLGTVITAKDRGINASNMVVQYIFLYLFPTIIEAGVVALVFVREFRAPVLASVAITGITLYTAVTIELTLYRMQFRKKMNKANNDASHKVADALLNISTVKYFTAEEHEINRFRESVDIMQESAYKIQGSLSLLNTSQQSVLNSTLVAALLIAAHECAMGEFTVGQFVAVNVYIMQLFAPLNFLGTIYGMAVGSYVDLQNLCNMFAEKPDIQDKEGAYPLPVTTETPLDVEFRNVRFSYPSRMEVEVLKGISFKVPAGSATAIVGATGAGKSTLTRLLFRFYEANEGQVLIGGHDVLSVTQKSLRENVGVVPQDHILFNDTLEYNIRYGSRDVDGDAVRKAVSAAELNGFVSEQPKGLATMVGERGLQVSGGQKQRIAIARVFIKDCPICILDEATSSLDSRTEAQIQKSLECLSGRTMIIIAHRLSTIQHADQIIVLSNGEVLEIGSHETLLAKGTWHEECYASLWDKQSKAV